MSDIFLKGARMEIWERIEIWERPFTLAHALLGEVLFSIMRKPSLRILSTIIRLKIWLRPFTLDHNLHFRSRDTLEFKRSLWILRTVFSKG